MSFCPLLYRYTSVRPCNVLSNDIDNIKHIVVPVLRRLVTNPLSIEVNALGIYYSTLFNNDTIKSFTTRLEEMYGNRTPH